MAREALNWFDVNTATFDGAIKAAWEAFQAAQFTANEARTKFEGMFEVSAKSQVPAGKSLVFSYKFNKLSIAFAGKAKMTGGVFNLDIPAVEEMPATAAKETETPPAATGEKPASKHAGKK